MNQLSNEDAAYIAGFLDGEGSISYSKYKKYDNRVYFQLTLSVANTDRDVLDWIVFVTGCGNVATCGKENRRKNKKTAYQIHWYHQEALAILRQLLPYLRVKRRRAELVLEMDRVNQEALDGKKRFANDSVPVWLTEKREVAYSQLKELNKRGIN